MKAMRRGNVWAASVAPAASTFAGGSMASSIGRAMTVPNPFRKVRRGICQVLFITLVYGRLTDEITFQTLQTQAANSRGRILTHLGTPTGPRLCPKDQPQQPECPRAVNTPQTWPLHTRCG